ncbi:hypothetical protein N0V85_003924 [Neurospora sp. IMI 360204]|nr:hypothetical protein N0V85_003924 [Neurospora sp. IMI 360204]
MTATVDDTTTNDIEAFALTVPALGLTYSSAGTIPALDLQPNWGLGQASTVPGQCSLILGLQPASKKSNLKLSDVLAVATDRGSTLPGLELMVIALENILTFHLDTSTGSRNAFWFEPMTDYKTVLRCQYAADSPSLVSLNHWIGGFLVGFTVQSVTAITKLQSKWVATNKDLAAKNNWEFIFTATVALDGVHVVPSVTFDFKGAELVLTLQFDYTEEGQGSLLGDIMAWIAKQKPMAEVQFDSSHWFQNAGTSNFNLPLFRRLKLSVPLDQKGSPTGFVDHVSVDLELGVKFGQPVVNGKPQKVVFLFTYEWSKASGSVLRGSLWTPPNPNPDVNRHFLPEFEPHLDFEPSSISDVSEWAPSLDLTNLIPSDPNSGATGGKVVKIPDGVPTQIIRAVLELDGESISFQGSMACQPPKSTDIPPLFLSNISLDASYTLATKDFHLLFGFGAAMNPPQGSGITHIELLGSLNYDTKAGWDVQASVETPGMQGAHFLHFFDVDAGPTATALIQHIALLYLGLEYHYQNGSGATNPASSFVFSGAMAIGKLELDLDFNYTGKDTWAFSAQAGAEGEESTLQEILDSIIGDGTVDLPSCVGNIPVGKPKPQPPESDEAQEFFNLSMTMVKADPGKPNSPQDVILTVSVNVGPVSFTFLQFRNTSWDLDKTPSKRFLRLKVHQLPQVSVPIIGDLTQPFDEMYFMWVQDGSKSTTPGSPSGLTMAEIGVLNGVLGGDDPIYYKLNKDPKDYKETDVLVQAGCHFVVVVKDRTGAKNVVLDYVFAQPTPDYSVPSPALALQVHAHYQKLHGPNTVIPSRPWERDAKHQSLILHRTGKRAGRPEADPPPDPEPTGADAGGGTTKAPMNKSIGPFSIANVGIRFSNSKLSVCLDAEVAIGPVAMAMQGFSIDLDFGHGHDLQHKFPTVGDGIIISLQGLSVAYDRPPLSIAGVLRIEHVPTTGGTFYAGGVEISFEQWQFLAAGGYGDLTDPLTHKPFKTAFVFAQLDGPLITLEFATIQGITGGFGYNNNLTLPTVAEVPSFPFLNMPTVQPVTGDATMDTLVALVGSKWFSPLDGAFWVGAGLTVSALEMLDITAVLVVEWAGLDVRLGIFAVAVCDVPSADAPAKLAHAELGILATVDFGLGLAKFEAQLAPCSYILNPFCHLSGGFALYYWFQDGPQQTKGDWVFTLGGYHRLYKPPPQYPVPPRLQIEWSLGPLSITGQAYFAITPNVAMAGGALHAYMGIGVLAAFFDAWIDFLINFKPFWFLGSGGVSVGVRFSLDLLFVTIHICVEIGATLTVYGPPIGGICHVDFWVFGFDIRFGAGQGSGTGAIGLLDFFNLALQKGSPAAASSAPQPLLFQCQTGMLPSGGAAASERARARREKRRRLRRRQLVQRRQSRPAPRVVELGDDGYEVRESDDQAVLEAEAGVRAAADDDDDDDDDDNDDDVPIWDVKGGTFSFAINAVFAMSKVTVYPEGKHPVVLDAPPKDTSPIRSRPMHLDKTMSAITSEFQVEMKITPGDSKMDHEPQWELRPVIRSVPKGLWDACTNVDDASTDPMRGSQSMLDTSTGGTVPLMMGVLFVAPKPILSHDKVQPFNAVLSQLQSVFPRAQTPPFPDSTTAENKAWLPVPPAKPDPSNNPARDWVAVQNAWKDPGLGADAGAAAAAGWAKTMGWDPGAVDGSVPVRLVEGLQVLYVQAPLVAQAA